MTLDEFINLEEKNLDDFMTLSDDDISSFDFSDDGAGGAYRDIKNDPIKKFFVYKLDVLKVSKKEKNILIHRIMGIDTITDENADIFSPDPDSNSPLLQEVYKKLWNINRDNVGGMVPCIRVQGETICSPNTTLCELYKSLYHTNIYGENTRIYHYANKDRRNEFVDKLDEAGFKMFAESYHTIGNFMPIPVDCNLYVLNDYFDIKLLHIYNYYHNLEERYPEDFSDSRRISLVKLWLDGFGAGHNGWKNFVERNHLKAFVGKDFKPCDLWERHFVGDILPDEDQCKEYFKNAADRIKSRSRDMIDALKRKY